VISGFQMSRGSATQRRSTNLWPHDLRPCATLGEGVVVLPFLGAVVEEVDVVDDLAFQGSVEPFGVDPMGALDLAVEARCGQLYSDVADAFSFGVRRFWLPFRQRDGDVSGSREWEPRSWSGAQRKVAGASAAVSLV
jgi:hypothetical protein